MIWLAVLANFILGALWRRWLGGWLGGRRWWRFAAMPLLCWPLLFTGNPVVMLVGVGICGAFFAFGHVVDDPKLVWFRYGPFAVAYWLALKLPHDIQFGPGGLIDGPFAVGELGLKGLFFGSLAVAAVLVAGG
jgi:hypothetical protein